MENNWYVKHSPLQYGNNNCCGGDLNSCLIRISQWARANPEHEVITVFLDKKENWNLKWMDRDVNGLDSLILNIFPRQKIYTPGDLLKGYSSLRQALKSNCPRYKDLRGKIIFAITNGTSLTARNCLNEYISQRQNKAICFIAPEFTSDKSEYYIPGIANDNYDNVIFQNVKCSDLDFVVRLCKKGLLTRVYGCKEDYATLKRMKIIHANYIAFFDFRFK